MANPQKENGFTPIANELLEIIYQSNFTPREFKIIFAVIRFTEGFHRNAAELSLSFLSNATKIHFRHVQTTVKNLLSKSVLMIENNFRGTHSRKIQLNTNYDLWKLSINKKDNTIENSAFNFPTDRALINLVKSEDNSALTIPVNRVLTNPVKSSIDQSSQPRKKKENLNKTSNYFSLPTELKEVKGFGEIWNDWVNYRKEIKKPLTPTAIKRQLNKLLDFKSKGFDIISIIDTSINRHWQDFFEPKENGILIPKDNTGQTKRITDGLKWLNPDLPGWM